MFWSGNGRDKSPAIRRRNIYFQGQLVLEDAFKKTLTMGMATFADLEGAECAWGSLMATGLLSIVPVPIIFLGAQRFLVEALAPGTDER